MGWSGLGEGERKGKEWKEGKVLPSARLCLIISLFRVQRVVILRMYDLRIVIGAGDVKAEKGANHAGV